MLVAVLPMVLERDVLRIILDFLRTEILEILHIKVVDVQILTIVLRVVELADAVIDDLSDLRAALDFLF